MLYAMRTPDKRCTAVKLAQVGYKLLALSVASFQTMFCDSQLLLLVASKHSQLQLTACTFVIGALWSDISSCFFSSHVYLFHFISFISLFSPE
jgi:hypothetical protein